MNAKRLLLTLLALALLSGCGSKSSTLPQDTAADVSATEDSAAQADTADTADQDAGDQKIVILDSADTAEKNTVFSDPFVTGTLTYELTDCTIYESLGEAGITIGDLIDPHNTFYDQDMGEQFQTVADYVQDDGTINERFRLVMLDMTIQNQDAQGVIKKSEFSVANIALRGGQNVSQYNVSYFSEAFSADPEQPLYYSLEQGNSLHVKIGYFVLAEDMENMIGVISDSDVQFAIR
jgi:uncharacterized protein YceK